MKLKDLQQLTIPDNPGIYIFKRKGVILYIGKATSLKDRVRSYFGKDLIVTRGPHLVDMITKSTVIDWKETDSVLEALILEAALIKKHQPYYNTKEKDDKSWNYVCITKEVIPKIIIQRGKNIDFNMFYASGFKLQVWYGPFTNGNQLREAMKIVRRIFPYIDVSSSKKQNYEFYRQLGLTPDLRFKNDALEKEYKNNIKNIKLFFEGKKKQIIRELKKEMMGHAKARKFEQAGEVKRQIFALEHINDVALIKNDMEHYDIIHNVIMKNFRIEAYDVAHMSGKNMVGVMTVVEADSARGFFELKKSDYRKFIIRTQTGANDTGALAEMLDRRLGHPEWRYPNLIAVDGSTAQINAATKVLKEFGVQIPIVSVVKDDRHKAKAIKGNPTLAREHESAILLANNEAHRFAITFHKAKRNKNFLN